MDCDYDEQRKIHQELIELYDTDNRHSFNEKLRNVFINDNFLIASINQDGVYQTRIQYLFIVILFIASLQLFQIIYLFNPLAGKCDTIKHTNVFLDNPKLFGDSITPIVDTKDTECQHKCLSNIDINPIIEFKLACHHTYYRILVQMAYIVAATLGFMSASYINNYVTKRKLLIVTIFSSTAAVFGYSINLFQVASNNQLKLSEHLKLGLNYSAVYQFSVCYILSGFLLLLLVRTMVAYLQDLSGGMKLQEMKKSLFLSFSMSQLIGALLELIIDDWKIYNRYFIGCPMLLCALCLAILILESPQDLLKQFINLCDLEKRAQISKYNNIEAQTVFGRTPQSEQLQTVREQKYQTLTDYHDSLIAIASINQCTYFDRIHFAQIMDRYKECIDLQTVITTKSTPFYYNMIFISLGSIYMGQLQQLFRIGTNLQFNMFCMSLAELLGQLVSMRHYTQFNKPKILKHNLVLYGIISMIGAMVWFQSSQSKPYEKLFQISLICVVRTTFPFILRVVGSQSSIAWCIIASTLIGFLFPFVLNCSIHQFFFIVSILQFIGSWCCKIHQ